MRSASTTHGRSNRWIAAPICKTPSSTPVRTSTSTRSPTQSPSRSRGPWRRLATVCSSWATRAATPSGTTSTSTRQTSTWPDPIRPRSADLARTTQTWRSSTMTTCSSSAAGRATPCVTRSTSLPPTPGSSAACSSGSRTRVRRTRPFAHATSTCVVCPPCRSMMSFRLTASTRSACSRFRRLRPASRRPWAEGSRRGQVVRRGQVLRRARVARWASASRPSPADRGRSRRRRPSRSRPTSCRSSTPAASSKSSSRLSVATASA